MKTPITDAAYADAARLNPNSALMKLGLVSRRIESDRATLMEALDKIENRHVIVGSTGDYRQGQLDALAACREVSIAALAAARANFPDA